MSSLILKQKHRRYTILSVVCVLPALMTVVAFGVEVLIGNQVAQVFLSFLLSRQLVWLQVFWLLLPLIALYLSLQAARRGTIARWRLFNLITFYIALLLIGLITGGGLLLAFLY